VHPFLASRWRLTLYLVAWLFIGAVLFVLLEATTPRPPERAAMLAFPMALLYAFMCLSAWWVCRAAPLGATSAARGAGVVLGAAVLAATVWAGLANVWAQAVAAGAEVAPLPLGAGEPFGHPAFLSPSEVRARDFAVFAGTGIALYLFSAAVSYLLIAFEKAREAERRALESQVLARDAELRALRAQLHPHFLFNSLNSINALVGSDPEGARRMCERLGDFLRQTLALAARDTVALSDEVRLLERYLAIEQVRFGERLASAIRVEDAAARAAVPPLLLQPLVENAVKHGISERVEGGRIEIEAVARDGQLVITVSNPYDEDATPRRGEGVGLENVRRRLRATAARQAQLTTTRAGGIYRAELVLSLSPGSEEAST
jgi:two-component sensor histidine kinase